MNELDEEERFEDFLTTIPTNNILSSSNNETITYRHTAEELAAILSLSPIQDLGAALQTHSNALSVPAGANYWPLDPNLQIVLNEPSASSNSLFSSTPNPTHNLNSSVPLTHSNSQSSNSSNSINVGNQSSNYSTTNPISKKGRVSINNTPSSSKKSKPNNPPSAIFTVSITTTNSSTNRTFPTSIPIINGMARLYRKFPISSAFIAGPGSYFDAIADLDTPEEIEVRGMRKLPVLYDESEIKDGKGSSGGSEIKWSKMCDPLNLFAPRFVRGVKSERESLCPICVESVERGGEGEMKWMRLKNSAYVYHMSYYHGISVSGSPFSPPILSRIIPVSSDPSIISTKKARKEMIEGLCHSCNTWIPLQSFKDTNTNIPEIFWWKHAKSCHEDSIIPGESGAYLEDSVRRMVLRKKEAFGLKTGDQFGGTSINGKSRKKIKKSKLNEIGLSDLEGEEFDVNSNSNTNDDESQYGLPELSGNRANIKGKGKSNLVDLDLGFNESSKGLFGGGTKRSRTEFSNIEYQQEQEAGERMSLEIDQSPRRVRNNIIQEDSNSNGDELSPSDEIDEIEDYDELHSVAARLLPLILPPSTSTTTILNSRSSSLPPSHHLNSSSMSASGSNGGNILQFPSTGNGNESFFTNYLYGSEENR